MTDASTSDMHNVCNYIEWAQANDLKLKFELSDEQKRQCEVSYNRKVYYKFDATSELTYLAQAELLQVLDEFAHIIFERGSLADASIFLKYAGEERAQQAVPKFALYSAHAETVAPMLHAWLDPQTLNPPPASMILFNYY